MKLPAFLATLRQLLNENNAEPWPVPPLQRRKDRPPVPVPAPPVPIPRGSSPTVSVNTYGDGPIERWPTAFNIDDDLVIRSAGDPPDPRAPSPFKPTPLKAHPAIMPPLGELKRSVRHSVTLVDTPDTVPDNVPDTPAPDTPASDIDIPIARTREETRVLMNLRSQVRLLQMDFDSGPSPEDSGMGRDFAVGYREAIRDVMRLLKHPG